MKPRHELKHEISSFDRIVLRSRLKATCILDKHSKNGRYLIRSLYFDNIDDKALKEKIDGVNEREKFRIRYYDKNTSFIILEKKSKKSGICYKAQETLTIDETEKILSGDIGKISYTEKPLLREFYFKMKSQGLRPKVIIDYEREPYTFPAGNVRVTMDYNIRTGLSSTDFLNPDSVTIPVENDPIILEVKYDEFIPDIIRDIVRVPGTVTSAYSKYSESRMYD